MPQDTNGLTSGSRPVSRSDDNGAGPRTAGFDHEHPTLAGLLEEFSSAATGESAAPDSASHAQPDGTVPDALRRGLLWAIQKELGHQIGALASRSLNGRPLTRRTVERVLQAAINMSVARKAALVAAGLPPTLEAPPAKPSAPAIARGQHPAEPGQQVLSPLMQRIHDLWLRDFAQTTMSAHSQDGHSPDGGEIPNPVRHELFMHRAAPSLEDVLRPLLKNRHPELLRHCVELTRERGVDALDIYTIGGVATRLHDRVRAFLEKQSRWPIVDADEYERHVKQIALVLAAWEAPTL